MLKPLFERTSLLVGIQCFIWKKVKLELIPDPFKWTDTKEFGLNKYSSNSSKGCVLKVDLEYYKDLQELHNDYPLA